MHSIINKSSIYQLRQIGLSSLIVCSILIGVRPVSAFEHRDLLEFSGIRQQLDTLPELVKQATLQNLETCEKLSNAEIKRTLDRIDENFNPQKLTDIATRQLASLVEEKHLPKIRAWLASDSGRIIRNTDKKADSLEESEQEKLFSRISASSDWRSSRKEMIQSLIIEAGIHEYITALHTEIAAQGAALGSCQNDPASIEKIRQQNISVRNDLHMISFFMMLSLIEPTAVAYRDLNDKVLNDYIDFSRSEAGKNYHGSLIRLIPQIFHEVDSASKTKTGA